METNKARKFNIKSLINIFLQQPKSIKIIMLNLFLYKISSYNFDEIEYYFKKKEMIFFIWPMSN